GCFFIAVNAFAALISDIYLSQNKRGQAIGASVFHIHCSPEKSCVANRAKPLAGKKTTPRLYGPVCRPTMKTKPLQCQSFPTRASLATQCCRL
ncbi:MAG: hypothetical protein Q4B46_00930, partial [Comamonadaceae bacterium]|nr:hypothetical protein [Comamonadaceae bacterium]